MVRDETKGGASPRAPRQRQADAWLNTPGNTVTSNTGHKLVGVFDSWIPLDGQKRKK